MTNMKKDKLNGKLLKMEKLKKTIRTGNFVVRIVVSILVNNMAP